MRIYVSTWLGTSLTVAGDWIRNIVEANLNFTRICETKTDQCKVGRSISRNQSWLDGNQVRIIVAVCFVVTSVIYSVESDFNTENVRFSVLGNIANYAAGTCKSARHDNLVLFVVEELDKNFGAVTVWTHEVSACQSEVDVAWILDWSVDRAEHCNVR